MVGVCQIEGRSHNGHNDRRWRDFAGGPVLRLCFSMQVMQVRSLVRNLRSHLPYGQKQKQKQKQYCKTSIKNLKMVYKKNLKEKEGGTFQVHEIALQVWGEVAGSENETAG